MGDIKRDTALDIASQTVYEGYKLHNDGHRVSTETTLLELIRSTHPDQHVILTSPRKCDLMGYAAAGFADITKNNDELYDASRHYQAPGPRVERQNAVLRDHVMFAQWQYAWKSHTFLLYETEYTNPHSPPTKLYFILSPKSHTSDEVTPSLGKLGKAVEQQLYFDRGHSQGADASTRQHFVQCVNPANE